MANCNGNSTGVSSAPLHGQSLKKMKCLTCEKVVFPPVMQCKNWHLVCNICRQTLVTCPGEECQEELNVAGRSGVAEKFLDKYVTRCKYFKDAAGCLEAFLKDDEESLKYHESVCPFREVKCLVPCCYKFIRLTCLIEHFEKDHCLRNNSELSANLNVSQFILERKATIKELVGDKSYKSLPCYLMDKETNDVFLAIFRMSSLRSPVFEISSVIYPYFYSASYEHRPVYRCRISAANEEDTNASFMWEGPISQFFCLTPNLCISDESAKLKWLLNMEVYKKSVE